MQSILKKLSKIIDEIDDLTRSCANCGHIITHKNALLCDYCYEVVLQKKSLKKEIINFETVAIPAFSLFNWIPDECNALSALTLSLKGKSSQKIWQEYAKLFLSMRRSQESLPANFIIVPCPNPEINQDHAWGFATALSELTGRPVVNLLKKGTAAHFRGTARAERLLHINNRLLLSENITLDEYQNKKIVFVDDIITTGTTVKSAYTQLKLAQSFEAWSLVRRLK